REMIELPLKSPEAFEKLGIKAPKGVILYGPPGCGKTLMGKAVANETDANFIYFSGAAVHGSLYGSSEEKVRSLFEEAQKKAPCILFIDEIDAMAPKRDEMGGNQEVEKRVVSQLLTAMDGLKGRGDVVVIGATNRPDALDEALRRPGRFDREIEIPIPNTQGRKEIFDIQTKAMPLDKDVNLEDLSKITHGYSGADIHGLCKEAAMKVLKRYANDILENGSGILDGKKISMKEFMEAYSEITPSGLRELYIEVPNVKWEDVGGLSEAKQELLEAVEWPLNHKNLMKKASKRQQKGILLEGPPGCGKTLLAKAIANKSDVNFISVTGADIMNKYVGESEKNIQKVFKKARMYSPCILFFDELETIAPERGMYNDNTGVSKNVVGQFLAEIDGVEGLNDVVILAATNKPEMIDKALLRPGRFDKKIHIGEPSENDRLEIYKIHTKDKPMAPDINLKDYTNVEGLTGAEIELICEEASKMAMRDFVKKWGDKESEKRADELIIEKRYFDDAIRAVKPDAKRRNNNQMDSDVG
ncbi:MAG: AAA family ATPase, partial [Candidatus Aenigmarchaeota archaeon]|nr:AAA family ATPase [Candidatus Aenigmarchaeota archaeon]